MNATRPWTPDEIREEYRYRIEERLGILAPLRTPTELERKIAEDEADAWLEMITINSVATKPLNEVTG